MKDALAVGEYVVTLTPADEDEDPSSVTFEAVTANKAERIEILGDYLVMKDTNFQEGYCFIKGYNQFDEPITLSGLTVTAAPSSSTQYDSSTGKLTVKSDTANQYAIIKQVTVYAQAMVDSKAVIAQKTLEVSSIGYPAEVEFGEITKDATNVPDISEGISINEINSGLYYIPIVSVKDNYGNDMLAKDLNYLDQKNLLTTVPTNDKSLYFSVRAEGSVFTEKNGQIVIFLGQGNGKPGTFNFLMTSAGGQFEKEVTVIENPYIDTLDVTLPDIYEFEETDEFGLVAHDQDGKELDLYDYLQAGEFAAKLPFTDRQNLTESFTTIDAGAGNGTWRVQKFADTKTYKVTFVPNNTVKSKGILTFVTTTASYNTNTLMATVGARGTSGNISSELKSAAKTDYDFNKNLQFLDANGKLMDRAHNEKYPKFVTAGGTVRASLNKDHTVNLTDEKIAAANHNETAADDFDFYYVVSRQDKTVNGTAWESVTQNAGPAQNGLVKAEGQYYVFLIASQDLTDYSKTRIIDSRTFYVSTGQGGDIPVSYTAKVNNKLYTGDQYDDDVEVKVTVTYRNGVTKEMAATGLALDGGFKVAGNKISKGSVKGDGSTTVSVYLATVPGLADDGKTAKTYTNDGAVATCTLTYSDDDPVGTSVDFKRNVQLPDYGTAWDEGETETVWDIGGASQITITNGELTMTNGNVAGDTYTMAVKDQYGTTMKNAKYYINGTQVPTVNTEQANAANAKVLEIKGQSKGSEVSKTFRVNVPAAVSVKAQDTTEPEPVGNVSTDDPEKLKKILAAAATNNVADVITFTGIGTAEAGTTLHADDTLVIDSGATFNLAADTALAGNVKNNGIMNFTMKPAVAVAAGKTFTNNGTITGVTTLTVNKTTADGAGTFKNTGKITLTDNTTVDGTVTNSGTYDATGHDITVNNGGTFTNEAGGEVKCEDAGGSGTFKNSGKVTATGTVNMFAKNTFHNAGTLIAGTITGFVEIESSSAKTIATTYTATTIVPAGVKATIKNADTDTAATLVLDNSAAELETAEIKVTNLTAVTVVENDEEALKVSGTTNGTTEATITVTDAAGAKIAASSAGSGTAADLSKALLAAGVTKDGSGKTVTDNGTGTDYIGADGKLAWAICTGLDTNKYYALVITTTNGSAIATSTAGQGYTVTGSKTRADYWNTDRTDQVNLTFASTTYKLYSLDKAPTANNLTGWTVDGTDSMYHKGTEAQDLDKLGWTLVDPKPAS